MQVIGIAAPKLHELGTNVALGSPEGYEAVFASITGIVKFFAAGWDLPMLEEAAKLAFDEYNWLTVAELKLFTLRVKMGKYPKNKNFNPGIYMECLTDFAHEITMIRQSAPVVQREMNLTEANTDLVTNAIQSVIDIILDIEQRMKEEGARERQAKYEALKNHRDQQIVDLVEHDAAQGIAPNNYMMKKYFECLERLAGN